MATAHVLSAAEDLNPELIGSIAAGQQVLVGTRLAAGVEASCASARAALRGSAPVYGVSTGMGALSQVRLSAAEQRSHQRNLLAGRATGSAPWLGVAEVRAIIAVRLRTFLSGDAGVSAALCHALTDLLAAGITPAVPEDGAGCAGEVIQLAHCFGPVAGVGRVLDGSAGTRPAEAALREAGLSPFELGQKEGIALLAGVPGATALGLLAGTEAGSLLAMLTAAAALSIVAVRAPEDPYADACARADPVLRTVLERIRALISPAGQPRMLQAPVSFRAAGPVLAQVLRAADGLAAAVSRALAGVTDSPAFLGGRFIGTAGFYGLDLAAHCDNLAVAVAHAAEVAAARTHRLLDPHVTGLSAQLAPRPGPDAGLVAVHKRAAGEVHALRRLAIPACVGQIETSGGQEDVQTFAWTAAVKLREAVRRARAVAACEALTAFQASALAAGPRPAGCGELLAGLARIVEPIEADRPFGEDIDRVSAGSWLVRPDA